MKLSVIISNRNDLVMLNLTINSCFEALKTIDLDGEIVICDNSDDEIFELVKTIIPSEFTKREIVKLIRQPFPCFTSARHKAAESSSGEYLFCIDSHVLIGQRTFIDSISFMDRHKNDPSLGFGHPPIRWAQQGPGTIRHTLKPSPEGLPNGGWDRAFTEERRMFWKYMPWICRREWFLNTLKGYGTHASARLSWGGAEQLMQVKSLMLGYENWAIITDPVIHIGPYNDKISSTGQYKYRVYISNGKFPHGFGILVSYAVLCGPTDGHSYMMLDREKIKEKHKLDAEKYWPQAIEISKDEHQWLMQNKKFSYNELISKKPWEVN